jgi:hypothetical protein
MNRRSVDNGKGKRSRPSQTARGCPASRCFPRGGGRPHRVGGFWLAAPSLAARPAQIWLAAPKSGDGAERPAEGHRYNARASIILISQTNPWHALSKKAVALSSRFQPSEFGTMKKIILVLLFAGCAPLLQAATDDPKLAAPFNAGELDQLLRPIALYPDPLVALILPASTFPADVVLAARFVTARRRPGGHREPALGRQCAGAGALSIDHQMDGCQSRVHPPWERPSPVNRRK